MQEETIIKNKILINCTNEKRRLWNCPRGSAYRGKAVSKAGNSLVLSYPQLIKYGLANGASDVIGIEEIEITPDMVGQKIGRFIALEIKTNTGKVSKEQQDFIRTIKEFGGIAGVARSVEEAENVLNS